MIPKKIHYVWVGGKEKPKDIKKTLKQLMKYIGYSKKLLIGLIIVVILSNHLQYFH